MYSIIRRKQFGPATFLWDVKAPDVARAAQAGHFVMARIDERGERIPLTVADYDRERGTVTVVIQAVGKTTHEMMTLKEGDTILDFIGPLGIAEPHPATSKARWCWWAADWAWRRSTRSCATTSRRATAPSRSSGSAAGTWCSGRSSSASTATS